MLAALPPTYDISAVFQGEAEANPHAKVHSTLHSSHPPSSFLSYNHRHCHLVLGSSSRLFPVHAGAQFPGQFLFKTVHCIALIRCQPRPESIDRLKHLAKTSTYGLL